MSDAKRQLFDDGDEEHPILEMNFLDGSGREDEPILTVKTVNFNQSLSSEDVPLAQLKTGSQRPLVKFTNLVKDRVAVPALVLNKFDLEVCPSLLRYKDYLEDTVQVSKPKFINPSISNINKVLYFLNPEEEKLESLCDAAKLNEFFNKLPTDWSFHFYNNYIKAILRFLLFCEQSDAISLKHPELISNLSVIRDTVNAIRQKFIGKKRKVDDADNAETPTNKKIKLAESAPPCFNSVFNSIENQVVITVDTDLPFALVRSLAIQSNPGIVRDKNRIARIRDRLKYQRNVLRVADAIAYFPRTRPTEQQVTDYLMSKNWLLKRTLVDVLKKLESFRSVRYT